MAFKKPSELFANGHVNLFKIDELNYVLVLAYADKATVIPMFLNKSVGYKAYIPASVDETEEQNISDFVKLLPDCYKGLPKFTTTTRAVPPHPTVIQSFVQPTCKFNKAKDSWVIPALNGAGYDTSNLTATITVKTKTRDYSDILATNKEAQERFKDVEEIVVHKLGGVSINDQPLQVKLAYEAIKNGKTDGAILIGPAGTGKSVACQIMAYEMRAPLIIYQGTEGTQVEDMNGGYKPSEDPTKQYEHFKGVALKAFSEGFQLVINEINFTAPGIQSIFNQLMDDTPTITQDGVIYKRHPNFVLYLTLNPGYSGTNTLNQALKSRFMKIIVDKLDSGEFTSRMTSYANHKCGCPISAEFYQKLYKLDEIIANAAANYGESVAICIRNAQQLTDLITNHSLSEKEFTEALAMSYFNNLCCDQNNLDNLRDFLKTDVVKDKIKELFALYDYRVIESVDITEKYDDCVEAPNFDPTTGKATRTAAEAADDFDLDELDGIGGDESAFDDLAEEIDDEPKAGSAPAAETEPSDEEDPDVDDLPEPEEDTEE